MRQKYINPNATEKQILNVSHMMVAAFALAMGIFGVIFFYIGVSMGWLYVSLIPSIFASVQTHNFQTFMGVLLGSAVVPIALCITWSKANKWGCIGGAVAGLVVGIIAWMVTTAKLNPAINVVTTGGDYEMLAGNLAAIGVGGIVSVVASYVVRRSQHPFPLVSLELFVFCFLFFFSAQFPEDFDFDLTRAINAHAHHHIKERTDAPAAANEDERKSSTEKVNADEKADAQSVAHSSVLGITRADELDPVALDKAFKFAAWSSVALVRSFIHSARGLRFYFSLHPTNSLLVPQTVIMIILIPLPLFFASTIYGVGGFTAWVVIAIIWAFIASFIVVLYPLYESRLALWRVFKGIVKDIMKPGTGKYVAKHHAAA